MSHHRSYIPHPPGGYPAEIARSLWALQDTRSRTILVLDGLQLPQLDWCAPENGNSIGSLLYHIAAIEMSWLFTEVLERGFPQEIQALFPYNVRDQEGHLTTIQGVTLQEHIDRLSEARAVLLSSFRDISLEDFLRPRQFAEYQVTPEWVLHHLGQHEAEHRGQIVELSLRARLAIGGS